MPAYRTREATSPSLLFESPTDLLRAPRYHGDLTLLRQGRLIT
jgi:hypothetical protein